MANQTLPTAAKKLKKKCRVVAKLVSDLIKRPKSASASQSNSISVSSHDPVPETDAGSAEPTASSKYIGSILSSVIDDDLTYLQPMLP